MLNMMINTTINLKVRIPKRTATKGNFIGHADIFTDMNLSSGQLKIDNKA